MKILVAEDISEKALEVLRTKTADRRPEPAAE